MHPCLIKPTEDEMYGLISKITAVAGKREELIAILLYSISDMPGCLSWHGIQPTQVVSGSLKPGTTKPAMKPRLFFPAVKEAIAKGRLLIAGFSNRVVTVPVGGAKLAR
jgi:hypothetical protein